MISNSMRWTGRVGSMGTREKKFWLESLKEKDQLVDISVDGNVSG